MVPTLQGLLPVSIVCRVLVRDQMKSCRSDRAPSGRRVKLKCIVNVTMSEHGVCAWDGVEKEVIIMEARVP